MVRNKIIGGGALAGDLLRKRREELGLDIKQAADQLRIRADYLTSIEQDLFDKLPVPVYTMGYIRSYAKYLGIDPAEILRVYAERLPRPKTDIPSIPVVLADRRRPVLLYAVLIIIASSAAVWLYLRMPEMTGYRQTAMQETKQAPSAGRKPASEKISPENIAAAPHTSALHTSTDTGNISAAQRRPEQKTVPPAVEDKAAVQTAAVPTARPAAPPPVKDAPVTGLEAGKDLHLLSIKAAEASWVSVRFSNGSHEQTIIRPGLSKEWGFSGTASVRIGNAGGVRVTFDGKEIGPLGEPKQAVTLTLPQ